MQVGDAEHIVKLLHVALIDTTDGEATSTHIIIGNEVGIHLVAHMQMQLISHLARDEQLVATLLTTECRYLTLLHILANERQVVVFTNTLEGYTQEVAIRLEDALRHRITFHTLHIRNLLEVAHQCIANHDRRGDRGLLGNEVGNLNMTTKAHHLVTDGMLESEYHTHCDNHHSQTNSNAHRSNTDSWATNLMSVAISEINSFGYE